MEFIDLHIGTSFVEILDFLKSEGIEVEGKYALEPKENVIYWSGLSDIICNYFIGLIDDKKIIPIPCHILIYMCDGRGLALPIAKKFKGYKTPHWIPITFYTPIGIKKHCPKLAKKISKWHPERWGTLK